MERKKKLMAGGVTALAVCVGFGGGYSLSKNGGVEELLEETFLGSDSEKNENDNEQNQNGKNNSKLADAGQAGISKTGTGGSKAAGAAGAGGANGTSKSDYVDNGGAKANGTSASESFSIKMSELCTFSDPSGISFDTRYVLYGDSECIPAKRAAGSGYNCNGAYVVLYAQGGYVTGEYVCYVTPSESDAQGMESGFSSIYNNSDQSCGRWGDVVYVYSTGDYVQTSIKTYYDAGAITSETPEAYLGMSFYFGGMSEYQPPASDTGSGSNKGGSAGSSTVSNKKPSTSNKKPSTSNKKPSTSDKKPSTSDKKPATSDKKPSSSENKKPTGTNTDPNPDKPVVPAPQPVDLTGIITTPEETYRIKMSEQYTFSDPENLVYDERYVFYADANSSAAKTVVQFSGAKVNGVFRVFYMKDGKGVAEYTCYCTPDSANAEKIKSTYQKGFTGGDVCILDADEAGIKQLISFVKLGGGISEETPDAYLQYLLKDEGYNLYEPALKGTKMKDAFTVKMSENCVFDEKQMGVPEYGVRYMLHGDESCPIVQTYAQLGYTAAEFYEVLYTKSGNALIEIQCYVMKDGNDAAGLASYLVDAGQYAVPMGETVLIINSSIQSMIDNMSQMGWIAASTPECYLDYMLMAGMKEYTASSSESRMMTAKERANSFISMQNEDRYIPTDIQLFAENLLREMMLSEEAEEVEETEETEETDAEEMTAETDFDPSEAGSVSEPEEKTEQEETEEFDASEAGDTSTKTDPESEHTVTGSFDPSEAGQVIAGADSGKDNLTADVFEPSKAGKVSEEASAESQAEEVSGEIPVTAEYTYRDPEGLEYDSRYVFYGNAESALAVQVSDEKNIAVSDIYVIFYVKDGNITAQYCCYAADGRAVCEETKPEELETLISSLPEREGTAYEADPDGYQNFIKDIYGLRDIKEQ